MDYSRRRRQEISHESHVVRTTLGWTQYDLGVYIRSSQYVVSNIEHVSDRLCRTPLLRRRTSRLTRLYNEVKRGVITRGITPEEALVKVPLPARLTNFIEGERDEDLGDTKGKSVCSTATTPPTPVAEAPAQKEEPSSAPAEQQEPVSHDEAEVDDDPVYADGAVVHVVDGWQVVVSPGDEPRIQDLVLAKKLGFKRPRNIRQLIDRHAAELPEGWIKRCTVQRGAAELSREGALYIAAKCETPVANEILVDMVRVYAAVSRLVAGERAQPQDLPLLQRIEEGLRQNKEQLEEMRIKVEYAARAIPALQLQVSQGLRTVYSAPVSHILPNLTPVGGGRFVDRVTRDVYAKQHVVRDTLRRREDVMACVRFYGGDERKISKNHLSYLKGLVISQPEYAAFENVGSDSSKSVDSQVYKGEDIEALAQGIKAWAVMGLPPWHLHEIVVGGRTRKFWYPDIDEGRKNLQKFGYSPQEIVNLIGWATAILRFPGGAAQGGTAT